MSTVVYRSPSLRCIVPLVTPSLVSPPQAQAVQEETVQELERLERSLEQREQRLESAGRGQEVQAAKEGLQKVKKQLDASRAEATH